MVASVVAVGLALFGVAKANLYGGTYQDAQCTEGVGTCIPSIATSCFGGSKYTCANGELTLALYNGQTCEGEPVLSSTLPATGQCEEIMALGQPTGTYSNWDCNSNCQIDVSVGGGSSSSTEGGLPADMINYPDGSNNVVTFDLGYSDAQCMTKGIFFISGLLMPSGCSCSESEESCIKVVCDGGKITLSMHGPGTANKCAGGPLQTFSATSGGCTDLTEGTSPFPVYGAFTCGSADGAVTVKVEVAFTIQVTGTPDAAAVTSLEGEIAAAIAADLGIPVADVTVTITAAAGGATRRLLQTNYNVAVDIASDAPTAAAANTIEDKLEAPAFATAVDTAVEQSTTVDATVQGNVAVGAVDKKPSASNTPNTGGAAEASLLAVVAVVAAAMA